MNYVYHSDVWTFFARLLSISDEELSSAVHSTSPTGGATQVLLCVDEVVYFTAHGDDEPAVSRVKPEGFDSGKDNYKLHVGVVPWEVHELSKDALFREGEHEEIQKKLRKMLSGGRSILKVIRIAALPDLDDRIKAQRDSIACYEDEINGLVDSTDASSIDNLSQASATSRDLALAVEALYDYSLSKEIRDIAMGAKSNE